MFPPAFARLVEPPFILARVESQERDEYAVFIPSATAAPAHLRARVSGALRHAARDASDLPAVGDYVALEVASGASPVIRAVVPRHNLFARRTAGGGSAPQPIAANVDTLFVTVACNRDFNLRRIERYLAGARGCGVPAAIVLTKSDLADDLCSFVAAAESVAEGSPVVTCCALAGLGLEALDPFRGADRTLAFVGSSGAGKSTLINALLGEQRLATGAARAGDDRGRHTTTRRQLLHLFDGTAIVDTPGMREFGLLGDEAGGAAFDDVAALAVQCRFRDCRHDTEPGCAVAGKLDAQRLAGWRKLAREAEFEARKSDRALRKAERDRWKAIAKSMRSFEKQRRS